MQWPDRRGAAIGTRAKLGQIVDQDNNIVNSNMVE
jgi:hypothetical protein